MKPFRLDRRTFLRGSGTAIGLPLLEAMIPGNKSAFAQTQKPSRFLAYYVPCGIHMATWTPETTGSDYAITPTLKPLADLRDDLLVLSNLENRAAIDEIFGDHARGTGSFLTASKIRFTHGDDIYNGISLDQLLAQQIGNQTPLPSLELGMDGGGSAGDCDSGYSCAYTRNIAWAGPQTPVPKLTNPRLIFNRLFSGFDEATTAREQAQRAALNRSILDSVMGDIQQLESRLGATDRQKLQEYLTSIEQLETSLTTDFEVSCAAPDEPASNYAYLDKIKVMADLMRIAFECDITRVQTFMLGNAASGRVHSFLGINDGHHTISHHQDLQSNFDKLKRIDHWEVTEFAYLLEALKNTTDVEGTPLLDSCSVLFSSEISDGNWHNHNNLPVLLAGRANGYFNTGRHIDYGSDGAPIANLYMSILDAMGAPVETFGSDGASLLAGLQS